MWVQISHRYITQTWFLFILSRNSEASAKCCFTISWDSWLTADQFLQLVADNIDHNSQTLDSLSTFHSIVMISAVTPGIKCTSRIVPHKAVTAEDVAAVAKIDFPFNMNAEMFSVKNGKLTETGKNDQFRNTDILWSLSWQFKPYNSSLEWYYATRSSPGVSWLLSIFNKFSSKKNRTSKLWIQYVKMLEILRKLIKAKRTENWMLHLQTVRDVLPYFAPTGNTAYTKSEHFFLCRMADYHLHIK